MKVEFEADYKDFAEISYLSWKEISISKRLFPYIYSYIVSGLVSSIPIYIFVKNGLVLSLITFSIILLVNFYFFRIPSQNYYLRYYFKWLGQNNLYKIEIEFSEKGIKTTQLGNEYLFGWQNIIKFKETNERICFFTNDNQGVAIPIRAFANLTERASFVAFAKSRISDNLIESSEI